MSTSIWPYDSFAEPRPPLETASLGQVTCFVVSPVLPSRRWDDLFDLIRTVLDQVGAHLHLGVRCLRADHISSPGVIHPEIWKELRTASIIICDVTGQNGNVMFELGVAAAARKKEHIIILRDINDDKPFLFDISPARHLQYESSFSGFKKLSEELWRAATMVLATVPFSPLERKPPSLPFFAPLTDLRDSPELYTEEITHRRILSDCLEFGAPLNFRYSWMSVSDWRLSRVRAKTDMKLTLVGPWQDPYMGVMVRAQGHYSGLGYLTIVRTNANVTLSVPQNELGETEERLLGTINSFDRDQFVSFDLSMDDFHLKISVAFATQVIRLSRELRTLPHVFKDGRVIFVAYGCRVGIRNIEVGEP